MKLQGPGELKKAVEDLEKAASLGGGKAAAGLYGRPKKGGGRTSPVPEKG